MPSHLRRWRAADEAARGSLRAVEQRYLHGAASYVELLVAQQQAQRTRLDLAGAQAQRLADSVALYLAIGADGANASLADVPPEVRHPASSQEFTLVEPAPAPSARLKDPPLQRT